MLMAFPTTRKKLLTFGSSSSRHELLSRQLDGVRFPSFGVENLESHFHTERRVSETLRHQDAQTRRRPPAQRCDNAAALRYESNPIEQSQRDCVLQPKVDAPAPTSDHRETDFPTATRLEMFVER
jgi:hypothetical protein